MQLSLPLGGCGAVGKPACPCSDPSINAHSPPLSNLSISEYTVRNCVNLVEMGREDESTRTNCVKSRDGNLIFLIKKIEKQMQEMTY